MTRKWIGMRRGMALAAALGWCAADPAHAVVLLSENFDSLPVRPTLTPGLPIASAAWTDVPPSGWVRDNTITPAGSPAEFFGWTFLSKSWWIEEQNYQWRERFTLGQGTVAVADPDAYDDGTNVDPDQFDASLQSPVIPLAGLRADHLTVSFDSSFRYDGSQEGHFDVSYDGGATWTTLRAYEPSDPEAGGSGDAFVDERLRFDLASQPDGYLVLRWALLHAGNNWWYAIDNVQVTANTLNLVANPSFESPSITPGTWTVTPAIPGWTAADSCGLEIQSQCCGLPAGGNQHVELDTTCPGGIAQTVATRPGTHYALDFEFSPRPGVADNHLIVRWNGQIVFDHQESGSGLTQTAWTKYRVPLTATGELGTLQFVDASANDGYGGYLDEVFLPEPDASTQLVGGVSAIALLARRRRPQRA